MLVIKNLHAEVSGKKILKGLSLEVKPEIHAIMGSMVQENQLYRLCLQVTKTILLPKVKFIMKEKFVRFEC